MKIIASKKQPLIDLLKTVFGDSSHRTLKNWILKKRIKLRNSFITKPHKIIEKGDVLFFEKPTKQLNSDLNIIYETSNYLIIVKPANLLTVPLDNKSEKNIFTILKKAYPKLKIFPVHRLDREVSGLVIFAKNKQTQVAFKELFERRVVVKHYIALVENYFTEKEGTFNTSLTQLKSLKVVFDPSGKTAITKYEVIDENPSYTTVLLRPITGRKHQLRVHLSNSNHPILGDKKYSSETFFKNRIALHAVSLAFKDPITQENRFFLSELPKEFSLKYSKKIYAKIKKESYEKRFI